MWWVPVETFELMRKGVYYDDSPLTEEERRHLLIQAGLRAVGMIQRWMFTMTLIHGGRMKKFNAVT